MTLTLKLENPQRATGKSGSRSTSNENERVLAAPVSFIQKKRLAP